MIMCFSGNFLNHILTPTIIKFCSASLFVFFGVVLLRHAYFNISDESDLEEKSIENLVAVKNKNEKMEKNEDVCNGK